MATENEGRESLEFLCEVIASISHELKNALATISETAGLLGDILASPGGVAEEAEEFGSGVASIAEEIERSLRVIRNLNRFAHSGDEPLAEVDVAELAGLMADLVAYRAFADRPRVECAEAAPVRLTTNPLLLEGLVYRLLAAGYRAAGRDAPISVTVRSAEGGAEIDFAGLGGPSPDLSEADRAILAALGGTIVPASEEGVLCVRLPA
jgi:signal transduction histidine kinase